MIIGLYINLIAIVLSILPNLIFYVQNQYDFPLYLLIYNMFANFFLIMLSIYNTYKLIELSNNKKDLKNADLYNQHLLTLVDSVRVFKHDYNNVVQSIGGYVALKDMNGLTQYFNGLLKDCQKVNHMEAISPDRINNPSIFGIIASKYQVADLKGITFNLECMFDFTRLNMKIYDFCKILGILLDNALEAAEESEEKIINIRIMEFPARNVQSMIIENSYQDKEVNLTRIYEKNYSSKKRNSGIGLWEVSNIVGRNSHVDLSTTKNEKFFKQTLTITTL